MVDGDNSSSKIERARGLYCRPREPINCVRLWARFRVGRTNLKTCSSLRAIFCGVRPAQSIHISGVQPSFQWQEPQEPPEHPEHPPDEEFPPDAPSVCTAHLEIRASTLDEPQAAQGGVSWPETSSSNSVMQWRHWYSRMGMNTPFVRATFKIFLKGLAVFK